MKRTAFAAMMVCLAVSIPQRDEAQVPDLLSDGAARTYSDVDHGTTATLELSPQLVLTASGLEFHDMLVWYDPASAGPSECEAIYWPDLNFGSSLYLNLGYCLSGGTWTGLGMFPLRSGGLMYVQLTGGPAAFGVSLTLRLTPAAQLDSLVPCAGPSFGSYWRNHGQYVSSVADAARALVASGAVTEAQAAALVAERAQSTCGR